MNWRNCAIIFTALALATTSIGTAQEPAKKKQPRNAAKAKAPKKPKLGQYKRVHQKALDMITGGQADEAVTYLLEVAERMPDDAETQYMLGLAYTAGDQLDNAESTLKKAIELGLPPGRIVAGPRDLLEPLHDSELYQQLLKQNPILHGPMVGDVTHNTARFWVRTSQPLIVALYVWPSDGPPKRSDPILQPIREEDDFTGVVRVTGLQPDTDYLYNLLVHNPAKMQMLGWREGAFRTAPAPGTPTRFKLAFGGGAGFVPQHEHMWKTIAEQKPDLLLLLGDNVYIDNPTSPHQNRYCYYRRQSRPEFRSLVANTPVYSIWDDHDFGTNDCQGGPAVDEPEWKRPVWQIFQQNWANPGYGGGSENPGCWYTFHRGDVQFIMLDGRYYRDRDGTPPSMLGPVQKAWLKDTLQASTATFKVLCSPVPWDFRTKGGSRDTWNGFREERDEIFSFAQTRNINGIVLMSADRHRSDAWQIERPGTYDLYEFNSSRLTNQHVHGTMPAAIFSYNEKQSFGVVSFDTTAADPTVRYEVVNIDGDVVHTLEVKLSKLTGGTK